MDQTTLPVAVIGAGPIGLAAAAHLHERGIPFVVYEAGDDVGASMRAWAHVQLFTPWRFNLDPAAWRLLEASGWTAPDLDDHPSGGGMIDRYLTPLALLPEISLGLRTSRRVVAVTRAGVDKARTAGRAEAPFVVTTEGNSGVERTTVAAVIDASGNWTRPNPLGADGRPAIGERQAARRIDHGIPDVLGTDRSSYARHRVAVVGSGHSAQNVVRDLARLAERHDDTSITWLLRRAEVSHMFGGRTADRLPERGRLRAESRSAVEAGVVRLETGFHLREVTTFDGGVLLVSADGRTLGPFDRVAATTGFRPDLEPLSELRLDLDPALESARALGPLIDPNLHDCGSVPPHGAAELAHPEPGLYVVGVKSYGRAPTFLLATGYEQARSVVAELAGDHAAATDIRQHVPETGVCSLDRSGAAPVAGAGACCG